MHSIVVYKNMFIQNNGKFYLYLIIQKMNLFDELGVVSSRSQGKMEVDPQIHRHQEIPGHVQTENDLEQHGDIKQEQKIPDGWTRFIKLKYYEQYFQVNQGQVLERVKYSITIPFETQFVQITKNNPDFYGPFWIFTTLILLLGFVGNFSNYLLSKFSSGEIWQKYFFKLEFIRQGLILVYTFGFGVPLALYFILKIKSEKLQIDLPNIICLYGYSLFCFIPAIAVCILPIGFLQWICLIYACVNSTLFLKGNLEQQGKNIGQIIMLSVIGGIQFFFVLCLKLIFLNLLENGK